MNMGNASLGLTVQSVYVFYGWVDNIIAPLHYCGSFFFYVLTGRQYRQEVIKLFCCRKSLGKNTFYSTSVRLW